MSATPSINFDPLQALYGAPYVFEEVCLIYSATLREIAEMRSDVFEVILQQITIHPALISKELTDVSGYKFILDRCHDVEFKKGIQRAITLFLHEDCLIMPESGVLALGGSSDEDKFHVLTEEEFSVIQEVIRLQHHLKPVMANSALTGKAKEIADKIAADQALVERLKNRGKPGSKLTFADMVASIAIGVEGLNLFNVWDLTYFAFYDQFNRFQQKAAHDGNVRAALAGAKISKKDLESWIRPLDTE